ncbi:MAG TPA: hypothetical protein VN688_19095 [Gemmataceae bacterium]|nr:hypothetical protein [Gemmataceae bacterium]
MFDLFTRSPRSQKAAARTVSLRLERLEDRLSPSGLGFSLPPPNPTLPSETVTMNVTYDPNKQVTLTGQLSNSMGAIANQTINFGGAVNGTATTDAQGNYSVTLTASQLGQVTAASSDGKSNTATATLASQVPTISSFTATCEGNSVWEFEGTVTGAPTQGEVVNLGGIPALDDVTVNVNPDGTFYVFATVSAGNGGAASAEAVDWWGDTSELATTSVPV